MDEVCFIKAHEFCRNGHQILIFVHSRNGTSKLALILKAMASDRVCWFSFLTFFSGYFLNNSRK